MGVVTVVRRNAVVAVLAMCALVGCARGGRHQPADAVGTVPPARHHGPTITVAVERGCPTTLAALDVANRFAGRTRRLLPADSGPTTGLVCAFGPPPNGATTSLTKSVRLNAARARRLADAVNQVSLAPASGRFSCPAQFAGTDTVIALRYPRDGDIDLWYSTSGCRTLDNGEVLAFQVANPSFYGRFQAAFEALVPD